MTNEEYLKKWDNHSNVLNFNFDDIYSALMLGRNETIEDFLESVDVDKSKLINSQNDRIKNAMDTIDEMLLQSSEELRVFVVDNLFEEIDDDEFMSNYHQTKSEVYELYDRISIEMVVIKEELEKSELEDQKHQIS
jgi:hypothetical protein